MSVKSIRLNKQAENMFEVVKEHRMKQEPSITDSVILIDGIEIQYDEVCKELNGIFREIMRNEIKEKDSSAVTTFDMIANMLEITSSTNGTVLQTEFESFLLTNVEGASLYMTDDEGKNFMSKPYIKVYDAVSKTLKDDEMLEKHLNVLYEAFYNLFESEWKKK